jgi:hypothetical protein
LQPIPSGRFVGVKNDNAVNLRLSSEGIGYLNRNWQTLISTFAPGSELAIPVNCTKSSFNLGGIVGNADVYIADQGQANGNGKQDRKCDGQDRPAEVKVRITGLSLEPQAPETLAVTLSLRIDTGDIYVVVDDNLCDLKCKIRFDSARRSPDANTIDAKIAFTIDTKWDKLLSFDIKQVDGTQICGSGGAPGAPKCISADDIDIDSSGGICSFFACDVLDIGPVKNFILGLLSPTLQTQIKNLLATQRCETCGGGKACPVVPNAAAMCQNDVCKDAADASKCVPRFLGVQGRLNLGSTLANFGAPTDAQLDLWLAAGSSVTIDRGLSFGTRVGVKAAQVAPCVPALAAPAVSDVPAPDFDAEAPSRMLPNGMMTKEYHAALGFSAPFLNLAFHEAHQAGALCLQLDTNNVGLINTGLFKTFLPSLGKVAGRDGLDAPMMVVLRPGLAPSIEVGEGSADPSVSPLLRLTLNALSIDFYAMLDDRYARLFSLTADITLPLALTFSGCDKVTPAIGNLKMLVTNVRTANSELLAEDPKVLQELIPAVIGLAEPAIAGALQPFTLPTLGNFKLRVTGAKGVGAIAGSNKFNHLGLYAELLPAMSQCAVTAPVTTASLMRLEVPKASDMRLQGQPLMWPLALLKVRASNKSGHPQFSVRLDNGLWSDFRDPDEGGTLGVSHPRLLIQGAHTIFVRARTAEDPHGVSAEVSVPVFIDWDPPEIALHLDREHDRITVRARDVLTPFEKLEFAYAIGQGAWSSFGAPREIGLTAIERLGGVGVRVRDQSGNVAQARFSTETQGETGRETDSIVEAGEAARRDLLPAGCSVGWGLDVLGVSAFLFGRRRQASLRSRL